eukprot:TRINITY_DN11164_c0_g1_i1.p1 TRINITY_DN11164_c0_g1~~TRINITY_DN11164_c0_g1_i1.p1  ORF type:complete len:176 (-),score=7.76 TRINITY_DN11164_c0_g1_i1:409-936(-)
MARFIRRTLGHLFSRQPENAADDVKGVEDRSENLAGGFRVRKAVAVNGRHESSELLLDSGANPVVRLAASGDGGVQGLQWYVAGMRVDEDGDVADEFLREDVMQNDDRHSLSITGRKGESDASGCGGGRKGNEGRIAKNGTKVLIQEHKTLRVKGEVRRIHNGDVHQVVEAIGHW